MLKTINNQIKTTFATITLELTNLSELLIPLSVFLKDTFAILNRIEKMIRTGNEYRSSLQDDREVYI